MAREFANTTAIDDMQRENMEPELFHRMVSDIRHRSESGITEHIFSYMMKNEFLEASKALDYEFYFEDIGYALWEKQAADAVESYKEGFWNRVTRPFKIKWNALVKKTGLPQKWTLHYSSEDYTYSVPFDLYRMKRGEPLDSKDGINIFEKIDYYTHVMRFILSYNGYEGKINAIVIHPAMFQEMMRLGGQKLAMYMGFDERHRPTINGVTILIHPMIDVNQIMVI